MANIKKILRELIAKDPEIKLDLEDLEEYGFYAARYHSGGYITVRIKGKEHYIHRLIIGEGFPVVDHINGNKLDNRKENLRGCNQSQNAGNSTASASNTSGYKGVVLSQGKYWTAGIMKDRKQIHIGNYHTPELAAAAYNRKAIELFGEFAFLNVIKDEVK